MSDTSDTRGKGPQGPRSKGPRQGGRPGAPRGDRPSGGKPFGKPRGDRPPGAGGDRKPSFGKPRFDRDRPAGGGGDRKPYGKPRGDRPEGAGGGDRKPFGKPRFDRDRPPAAGGDRKPYGKPRGDRPEGAGGGDRKPFGKPRFDRDRSPAAGGDRKSYGKPRGDRPEGAGGGDRKPFGKPRFDRDRPEGAAGGDRKPFGKPRFDRDRPPAGGGDRKPFGKPRFDRDRPPAAGGDRKPYGKPRFDRDRAEGAGGGDRKPFGKPRFDRDRTETGGGDRKPFSKPRFDRDRTETGGGDRKPFTKPRFDRDTRDDQGERPARKPEQEGGEDELVRVGGLPSVAELFRSSPDRVERLFFTKEMHPEVNAFCSKLAERRKVYREVEADELRRIAGSAMHGGVVALAEPKPILDFDEEAAQQWAAAGDMLIVLDGIGNPQNIGAIARTASFFGVKRLVISDHPSQGALSNAAYRIAKGGLEGVDVFKAPDLAATLRRLKAYFHVVGTALEQGSPLESLPLAPKPVALVLGNEENGIPEATLAACHSVVSIPGGGTVQSLNVSAAAAILIYALQKRLKRT